MQTDNLHFKLMESMRKMGEYIERGVHPFCAAQGITSLQLIIIMTLHFKGPQTISGLAKRTCMAGANNSALCKRLEKDGFVRRERDEADERQVLVSLTPVGGQVATAFLAACEAHKKELATRLSPQQATHIISGFNTLFSVLEALEQTREEISNERKQQ